MTAWIKPSDKMPEEHTPVLVDAKGYTQALRAVWFRYGVNREKMVWQVSDEGLWVSGDATLDYDELEVNYWMSLPLLPHAEPIELITWTDEEKRALKKVMPKA